MGDQLETADLEWQAGDVPLSTRFQDPYFSRDDGLAETRHVFLEGNALPARFTDGFHIAELGFGTGLNFLTTWALWRETGQTGTLRFTSFEAFPMSADETQRALAPFTSLAPLAAELVTGLVAGLVTGLHSKVTTHHFDGVTLEVIHGDARTTLPTQSWAADAWFLDGFSPAKNPELWEAPLMAHIGTHTKQGGTCATYTAAGFVRRALQDAGFDVRRTTGYGRKRHMTQGTKQFEPTQDPTLSEIQT